MYQLHPHQALHSVAIDAAWARVPNVLAVAPTGSGKTVLASHKIREHNGAVCMIAHRQELVSQISLSLAENGVPHRIIAQRSLIKFITSLHHEKTGQGWYDPTAQVAVAGVLSLTGRASGLKAWAEQVTLWVMDEAHHVLRNNQWGKAVQMFPNARGLGLTATPVRADGKGLGRHAAGYFDELVEGANMRWLIDAGYLSDYKIFAPTSDLDLSRVDISKATGDFSAGQLREATAESHITGDVVKHYLRHAPGELGLVFLPGAELASEQASRFSYAGVPSAAVGHKTPERERHEILRQFGRGDIKVLNNVDLFGEGYNLPALSCVSMARATTSFGWYSQAFGRGLRISPGKTHATIIDHVGNVQRHCGPPDFPRPWSLDGRGKGKGRDPDLIPYKICAFCEQPFEAFRRVCPFCFEAPVPEARTSPEFVDGDLVELDPDTLAQLRAEITAADRTPREVADALAAKGAPQVAWNPAYRRQMRNNTAQERLRRVMSLWGGVQARKGRSDSEAQKRFWFRFKVDVMSAQALTSGGAESLTLRVVSDLGAGVL